MKCKWGRHGDVKDREAWTTQGYQDEFNSDRNRLCSQSSGAGSKKLPYMNGEKSSNNIRPICAVLLVEKGS